MSPKLWRLKLNATTLVMLLAAIGINYLGKIFCELMRIPLWLDTIGTCLAAIMAGPIAGAIAGVANNLIYGISVESISIVYALTNMSIGIVVGILAHKGFLKNRKGAVVTGLIVGVLSVVVSTPLNLHFWEGTTGNYWGDAVFAFCIAQGVPVWAASVMDELMVDIPDKLAVLLIVYEIAKEFPESLYKMFQNGEADS